MNQNQQQNISNKYIKNKDERVHRMKILQVNEMSTSTGKEV